MEQLRSLGASLGQLPAYLRIPLLLGAAPVSLASAFIAYLLLKSLARVLSVRVLHTDAYNHVPRPRNESWLFPIYGDLSVIQKAPPAEAHIGWIRELKSNVYVYRGALYSPRLMMADARAMNYVLGQNQSYEYPKPEGSRKFLSELLGDGLLVAEGEQAACAASVQGRDTHPPSPYCALPLQVTYTNGSERSCSLPFPYRPSAT